MKFGLLGDDEDHEHTGIGFVETIKIFAMQNTIFIGTEPLDRV